MKLPFYFLPASWGLKGDAYAEAEAHYYLEGEALDRKLIQIRYKLEPDLLKKKLLDIDLRYLRITQYEYDSKINELIHEEDVVAGLIAQVDIDLRHKKLTDHEAALKKVDILHKDEGLERDLALLKAEHDTGKIDTKTYEKKSATLKNEPWVSLVDSGFNPDDGIESFYLELDWNPQWIDYLKLHGFVGHTDEQIVEEWFTLVCNQGNGERVTQANLTQYPMGFDGKY